MLHILNILLSNPPNKLNYFNFHFLIQKVGLRGCESLVQGARARKDRRWDSNPGCLAAESVLLTAILCCHQFTQENLLDFVQES